VLAQQRAINGVFKNGNYTTASENPPGGLGRCNCLQAQFDCICGFVDYSDSVDVPFGQISVPIASQVISGNTLQVKFKEKLRMELKTNDFIQGEVVEINSEIAKSLGYKSIKILPGKYTISDGQNLVFNIEKGVPNNTPLSRGWFALLIIFVVLVSIIWGQSSAPSGTTLGQDCIECRKDMAWYSSLPNWKKALFSAWYALRWSICKARGCI